MKIISRLTPRGLRILFAVAATLVFVVTLINFMDIMVYRVTSNDQCRWIAVPDQPGKLVITDIFPGGVTEDAGVLDGDTLLRINGKPFSSIGNAQQTIDAFGVGDSVTYTLQRGAETIDLRIRIVKLFNLPYLTFAILGLGFLIVGTVVFMTRPEGMIQRMFGRFALSAMLLFGFYGLRQPIPGMPVISAILTIALILGYFFFSPLVIKFFLHYPLRKPVTAKRWSMRALYLIPVLNIGLVILFQAFGWPQWTFFLMVGVPYTCFIIGMIIFAHSYFTRVPADRRPALRPILLGMLIGGSGLLYTVILSLVNPFTFFFQPWLSIPGIAVLVIPVTFGYSIFRYRLMDIDLIVKRSLIYGAVTAAIAAIYLLVVYGIGNLMAYFLGTEENRLMNIVAFVMIALLFDPMKRRTQSWVDRNFYQERLNYQRALLEFSQELPRLMNLEQIMESIVGRISGTMHVERVATIVRDDHRGLRASAHRMSVEECTGPAIGEGLMGLLADRRTPLSFPLHGDDPDGLPLDAQHREVLRRSGIILSVPMILKDRLIGCINAGPKLSGKAYSQDDIDLLSTVAGQAAIAIENARLHSSEIEKHKLEEELAMARRIQAGLFPKQPPVVDGLSVAGSSLPATSVGGDYYDYIRLDEDRLLTVVADVSGKGMSAALYMSKIQGMIQLAAHMYDSPGEMLVHVNRRLYDGIERNSFITMVLALFDTRKKEVVICRAGHNRPLVSVNGDCRYLDSVGIGLGLERGPVFEGHLAELRLPLAHGSLFLLYSDGLTEAMNESMEQFGDERLKRLCQEHRHLPPEEIRATIAREVEAFRGNAEQHDDITILLIKYE